MEIVYSTRYAEFERDLRNLEDNMVVGNPYYDSLQRSFESDLGAAQTFPVRKTLLWNWIQAGHTLDNEWMFFNTIPPVPRAIQNPKSVFVTCSRQEYNSMIRRMYETDVVSHDETLIGTTELTEFFTTFFSTPDYLDTFSIIPKRIITTGLMDITCECPIQHVTTTNVTERIMEMANVWNIPANIITSFF